MTRHFFLPKWIGWRRLTYSWLLLLITVVSVLPLMGIETVHAQSQAIIISPTSGTSVSGDVIITGTATQSSFERYELAFKQEPSSGDAYIYFDGGNAQVTNGPLGIWRTAALAPGTYTIRLRVIKPDSNYDEVELTGIQVGQASTEPTPTPTSSEPTPTSIPTATFTPAPQPTPIVGQVTQPAVEGDAPILAPTATTAGLAVVITGTTGGISITTGGTGGAIFDAAGPTPQEVTTGFTRELGEAVALNRLRSFFVTGIRLSATLILGCVVLLAGKRLFGWLWTQYR